MYTIHKIRLGNKQQYNITKLINIANFITKRVALPVGIVPIINVTVNTSRCIQRLLILAIASIYLFFMVSYLLISLFIEKSNKN